jgi:DNA-binding CsgD family transcriptional regulator
VFNHIVQGLSVAQIAEALNVSRATIRTHLSRLFDKTDTHRQGDLIHIAASLSVPISF